MSVNPHEPARSPVSKAAASEAPPPRGLRRMLHRTAQLGSDQEGSAMVFGALTILTLATATFFVINIGLLSSERLQLQNAADAAAYSAALVEANSLNSVAAINDGMAYVHFNASRYAIDVVVFGTFAALQEHPNLPNSPDPLDDLDPSSRGLAGGGLFGGLFGGLGSDIGGAGENPRPDARVVGIGDANQRFADAAQAATQQIPRAERWLRALSKAEEAIAFATPILARQTAVRVAADNGAEATSVLPRDFFFFGGDDDLAILERDPFTVETPGSVSDQFARRYATVDLGVADKRLQNGEDLRLPNWWDANSGSLHENPNNRGFILDRRYGKNSFDIEGRPQDPVQQLRQRARDPVAQPEDINAYYQTRICWNPKDLEHGQVQSLHSSRPPDIGGPGTINAYRDYTDAPNGHWHILHEHIVLDPILGTPIPIPHQAGHFEEDEFTHELALQASGGTGPREDALTMITMPLALFDTDVHHGVRRCPTCRAEDHDGDKLTDVRHTPADIAGAFQVAVRGVNAPDGDPNRLFRVQLGGFDQFRPPLLIRPNAIREPVRVATWRRSSPAVVASLFANPEDGMVAVASARVGVAAGIEPGQEGRRPAPFPWSDDDRDDAPERAWSLLYSFLEPNTGFSARLTPSNGQTVVPDGGLQRLASNQWWDRLLFRDIWRDGDDQPTQAPLQAFGFGGGPGGGRVGAPGVGGRRSIQGLRGGLQSARDLENAVRH